MAARSASKTRGSPTTSTPGTRPTWLRNSGRPFDPPDGLAAAVAAARAAGLLIPVASEDAPPLHFVHLWTAGALTHLYPDTTTGAHIRAAAFWHWRIGTLPQSREQDIEQLLEARYHHHAAGDLDEAIQATETAVLQLQTWGQYGRAAGLCRQTLTWLQPDAPKTAVFQGQLGILAYLRGDYDTAEQRYHQALTIFEHLGDWSVPAFLDTRFRLPID